MDKNNKLKKFAKYILESNDIKVLPRDNERILRFLYLRIDALIFKTVSYYCLTAATMKNDKLRIYDQTFANSLKKSAKYKNYKSSGGTSNPASYYGVEEKMYKESNNTKDLLHINFDTDEIRPQIGGGKIPWAWPEKILYTSIGKVLKYHEVYASNYVKDNLVTIISNHIIHDMNRLKKFNKEYTYDRFIKKLKN